MRILHIIDHLGSGGAQSVVQGIFNNISLSNYYLYSLRKKENSVSINNGNVTIDQNSNSYSLAPIWKLKKVIKEENIEIIHCHLLRSQIFGWLLKMIWFPNVILIFHEHGRIYTNNIAYPSFLRLAKKNVNKFITVSNSAKKKLIDRAKIPDTKIIILPNFVDFSRFHVSDDSKNNHHEKNIFTIGFAGRLSPVKGCEYLIKALPYLNINYKVLIAGDGPLRKKLVNLATSLKVSNKIEFLGYVPDIENFYKKIDVLVVPSLHESFGMSVIEAQAMKVPVIASDVEALNELIINNHNGLLFKKKDGQDLAKKITFLNNNPSIVENITHNATQFASEYTLDLYINKLNNFYEKL
jgi:glycosyltransferase involved in cell wall biosynthesis